MQLAGWCWERKHEKTVKKNHRPSILPCPTTNHWFSLPQIPKLHICKTEMTPTCFSVWCQMFSVPRVMAFCNSPQVPPVIKSNVRICSQAIWWIFLFWELYELICPESFLHFLFWEGNIWLRFLTFCSGVLSLLLNAALIQPWWQIQLCLLLPFSIFL